MTEAEIQKLFHQATNKALVGWETNLEPDEIISELWVWYQSRPSVRRQLDKLAQGQRVLYVRRHVFRILAGEAVANDMFDGRNIYSSDAVRDALLGQSTNRYLVDILPLGMEALSNQNEAQAEAIRSRYDDGIVPPASSAGAAMLKRAVKSLTEQVNIIAHTAGVEVDDNGRVTSKDGPGSRDAIFPDIRKSHGDGHSDPTANIAILLIENPELRDEYLYEPPIRDFLKGAAA